MRSLIKILIKVDERTFQRVLQERDVKHPVRQMMRVFELHEEAGEDEERTDEEIPQDRAVLDVENRSDQQSQALRDEAHQQVDGEEAGEAEELKRLAGHEVRDENVNDRAEHLNGDVGDGEADEIGAHRIPAVEMLTFYDRQLQWNCKNFRRTTFNV